MDKKNTMLLTVIAVATLLVAVVGATFAYFSISATYDSATSKVTGNTENAKVGNVVLTGSESLALTLTAEHMATAKEETTYWASTNGTPIESTVEKPIQNGENKIDVGVATLTGGSADVVYYCTANYKVVYNDANTNIVFKDGTEGNPNDNDEAVLTLSGEDENVTIAEDLNSAINLKALQTEGETGKTGVVTFKLTGNGTDSPVTKKLQATLSLKNSKEDQRERLAGKKFTINFTVTSFNCDTTAPTAD